MTKAVIRAICEICVRITQPQRANTGVRPYINHLFLSYHKTGDCIACLRNSAQTTAAATATFNDSAHSCPSGKLGIKSRSLICISTAGRMPFPSLPITRMPLGDNFFRYRFSPSRNVPYTGSGAVGDIRPDRYNESAHEPKPPS